MTSDLVELVGLLKDKNPVVRQLALENLLPYTQSGNPHADIWKTNNWQGGRMLKILVCDTNTPKTSQQAIAALINLSAREEPLRTILIDDSFLSYLLSILTDKTHQHADLVCMLLSNLAKSPRIETIFGVKVPEVEGLMEKTVLGQLMEVFVLGENKKWNPNATFDFLANVWGDLTRCPDGRKYLLTPSADTPDHYPFQSLLQYTSSPSLIRRSGGANAIKNSCFDTAPHILLLSPDKINILPSLLLPLCTGEEFSEKDSEELPIELQLLPETHKREESMSIVSAHLETLLLLTTTFPGREIMRKSGVYVVVRRLHEEVEDEDVKGLVERLVNVLMRDEEKVEEVNEDEIEEVA